MRVAMINGSPRRRGSASADLLRAVAEKLGDSEIRQFQPCGKALEPEAYAWILGCDALLFAFPLYVDSFPSHLLQFLTELEEQAKAAAPAEPAEDPRGPLVYCIVNNGFYEGQQNRTVLKQMELWCEKAGLRWGQGIGIGAGEMLKYLKNVPAGHGPKRDSDQALALLAEHIRGQERDETIFTEPNWPRPLFMLQGTLMQWYARGLKNGVAPWSMRKR